MSLDDAIHALSNFNAIAGSINGYNRDKQNGVSTGDAISNVGYNLLNGVLRNEASREILYNNGSYLGYAVNAAAGYGDPVSNYQGTMGTISAAMLTQPYGIFGCRPMHTSLLYGCGPFGGGYWGGGCGCGRPLFGGPSFFGMRGFWC